MGTRYKGVSPTKNVYCKISGLVTEADWKYWKESDIIPYLDVVFEAFGVERLMYGSDWPVCLLAAEYEKQMSILKTIFQRMLRKQKQNFRRKCCKIL